MGVRDKIVEEVAAEMVQPAEVVEGGQLAVALFDENGKHIFSIQRATDQETRQLAVDLRLWLQGGMERVLERAQAMAASAGG